MWAPWALSPRRWTDSPQAQGCGPSVAHTCGLTCPPCLGPSPHPEATHSLLPGQRENRPGAHLCHPPLNSLAGQDLGTVTGPPGNPPWGPPDKSQTKSTELQCGDQSPEFTPQEQTKNVSFSGSGCPESDFRPVQFNATREPGDSPPLPGQQESSGLLGAGSEGPWQSHPAAGTCPAPTPQRLRARAQGPGRAGAQACALLWGSLLLWGPLALLPQLRGCLGEGGGEVLATLGAPLC